MLLYFFANGTIRNSVNAIYRSETPSTIIEFKSDAKGMYAGAPETYTAIVITSRQEIDAATYNHIQQGFDKNK